MTRNWQKLMEIKLSSNWQQSFFLLGIVFYYYLTGNLLNIESL